MNPSNYKVVVTGTYAKLKIRSEFEFVSDDFRKSFDDWLASQFGYNELLKDAEVIVDHQNRVIYMNQRTHSQYITTKTKYSIDSVKSLCFNTV